MKIYCEDTKETCNDYSEYLLSDHWYKFKKEYRRTHRTDRCYLCNHRLKEYHFHHLNYETLGNEQPFDVHILCPSCHNITHDESKKKSIDLVEEGRSRPYYEILPPIIPLSPWNISNTVNASVNSLSPLESPSPLIPSKSSNFIGVNTQLRKLYKKTRFPPCAKLTASEKENKKKRTMEILEKARISYLYLSKNDKILFNNNPSDKFKSIKNKMFEYYRIDISIYFK